MEYGRLPDIDRQLIVLIMKTVSESTDSRGRKMTDDSQELLDDLDDFYEKHYRNLTVEKEKLSYTNLGQSLEYEAISILTCLTNHIQEQFETIVNRYINILVDRDNLKKTIDTKALKSELYKLKTDILYNKSNADSRYDSIKQIFKDRILQSVQINKSLAYMSQSKPLNLLILMIRMSLDGERIVRSRQSKDEMGDLFSVINCFPLRKNIRPKYVDLDTSILISRLMSSQKGHYSSKGNKLKLTDEIWNKFFDTNKKVFRKSGYTFNRRLSTDGVGCTILFVRNDLFQSDKKTVVRTLKKPKDYKDDMYINDLPEDQLQKMRDKTLVGIDPGYSDLIFCTDGAVKTIKKDNGKTYRKTRTFRYSRGQRRVETKSRLYADKIDQNKKNTILHGMTIKGIENLLSRLNASSCEWNKAICYIQIKNLVNDLLLTYYEQYLFRKLNWYSFINTQRSEADMINRFEGCFGSPKDTIILMGDFSRKSCMKYQAPTKGKSIRKLFKNHGYQLYLVNEYNTSARLIETGEKLTYIRWDSKRDRYVHRLLGSEILKRSIASKKKNGLNDPVCADLMECGYRPTIINRDLNGSLNIRYKGWCIINGFEIPSYMKRQKSIENRQVQRKVIVRPKASKNERIQKTTKLSHNTDEIIR
jgi:hypothetical protein